MISDINTAIITTVTQTADDLFPFTREVPRELLPMGGETIIERIVNEIIECNIKEIMFIISAQKKQVINHFKNLEKISDQHQSFAEKYSSISFSGNLQKNNSDAFAIYKNKESFNDDGFVVSFSDIIFHGNKSSLAQLFSVYRSSQKPVVALREVGDEEAKNCCIVETEKIANRFYKIKKIIPHPSEDDLYKITLSEGSVSDKTKEVGPKLALAGRFILTPTMFEYTNAKTSVIDTIDAMIHAGKTVYGHKCEGQWFPIIDKSSYLQAQKFFLGDNL